MKNTNSTLSSVETSTSSVASQNVAAPVAATAEVKTKRPYHRLTVEEVAAREAAFTAYKEAVAKRKAERAAKKAEREAAFAEHKAKVAAKKEASKARREAYETYIADRRTVTLDLNELTSAIDNFKSNPTASVAEFRDKLALVMNASRNIEKQMFHRSPKTVVSIKA